MPQMPPSLEPDPTEPPPRATELRAKIKTLQQRKMKYQALKQGLQESGAKQVSLTDPDAHSMVMHHHSTEVGYKPRQLNRSASS